MAVDNKYGQVTLEHGDHIPDDEPVVVFRAKDKLLVPLLNEYAVMCEVAGSPSRHLDLIAETTDRVRRWQAEHATKTPDSETSRAWRD